MPELTMSASVARRLMDFAVSRGASQGALVGRSGIDPTGTQDHDQRVPFVNYIALMRAAQELCADPALALHFAEAVDTSELSIVGLISYACETMMESLQQLNRYARLVVEVDLDGPDRFALRKDAGGLWCVDQRKDPNCFPELTEMTFTRMTCEPRRFLPRPHVLEVHVTHAVPAHRTEYDRIFQCPVVFESHWNALRIDPAVPTQKIQLQPRYVFGVLCAHADALLQDLERSKTMRGRVESLLIPILHKGDAGIDAVAASMEMSRQTLYRKLKAEGETFEHVLDDLRRRMALNYLNGGKISVSETAYLVGFSEAAAFSRAFKRWTGMSPQAARTIAMASSCPKL
jgi:AraC-like DNA-binding protein